MPDSCGTLVLQVEALEAELRRAAGEGGGEEGVQQQSSGGGGGGSSGEMQELEKLAEAYQEQLEAAKAARMEDAVSMKALQEELTTFKDKAREAAKGLKRAEDRQRQAEATAAEATKRAKTLKDTLAERAASHDAEMRESGAAMKTSQEELKAVRASGLELKSAKEALVFDLQVVQQKLAKAEAQVVEDGPFPDLEMAPRPSRVLRASIGWFQVECGSYHASEYQLLFDNSSTRFLNHV